MHTPDANERPSLGARLALLAGRALHARFREPGPRIAGAVADILERVPALRKAAARLRAAPAGAVAAGMVTLAVLALGAGTYAAVSVSKAVRLKTSLAAVVARAEERMCAPEEEPDALPDADESVRAVSLDAPGQGPSRSKIREAEALYRRAVKSYERGDRAGARELYERSLAELGKARITADAYYRAKNDLAFLFKTLDRACAAPGRKAGERLRRPIPLDAETELVRKYLKIYTRGKPKEKVLEALERSGRYRPMIQAVLREYGLPEDLVYLPLLESLYDENDLSRAGALGLWQLMPARARELGLRVNIWIDERKDPERSTRAAARYLKQLFTMFDDWHLALAAYNRGENGLARDLAFSNATDVAGLREQQAVPRETQNYVPQFIVCVLIGRDPEKYGFRPVYEKPLVFDEVTVNTPIDLEVVARCAGVPAATIRRLNPALTAWCTPLNYPGFVLRLPAGTKKSFAAAIAAEKELNPTRGYVKYRVAKGDSLGRIARMFCTTADAIREDNRILRYRRCRVNQLLVIRPGKQYYAPGRG